MDENTEANGVSDSAELPSTTADLVTWRALARTQILSNPFAIGLDGLRRLIQPTTLEGYKLARQMVSVASSEALSVQLDRDVVEQFRRLAFALTQRYHGQETSHHARHAPGYSRSAILRRGWTPIMIDEVLGEPDLPKSKGSVYATYSRHRVEQAEQDPRVKDRFQKLHSRRADQAAAWDAQQEANRLARKQKRPPLQWHLPDGPTMTDVVEALAEVAPPHLHISASLIASVSPLYSAGRLRALALKATTRVTWPEWSRWQRVRTGTLAQLSTYRDGSVRRDLDSDLVEDLLPHLLEAHPELSPYADICSPMAQQALETALLEHYAKPFQSTAMNPSDTFTSLADPI